MHKGENILQIDQHLIHFFGQDERKSPCVLQDFVLFGAAAQKVKCAQSTDGQTDERKSPCVLQDFVPFGAAALLPLNLNQTLLKQSTGTADHLTLLRLFFSFFTAF